MEALIRAAGRVPRQRTTLYGEPPSGQVARSFGAPPLAETRSPHVSESRLERPRVLVRPADAA
jgi:FO synthase